MPPYYLHPWIINYVFILAFFQSHGSGFLRQGAFVFGIGSFIYHLLEFITYFIIDLHPNCMDVLHTVNSFLSIIFVILQVCIFIRNFFHPNKLLTIKSNVSAFQYFPADYRDCKILCQNHSEDYRLDFIFYLYFPGLPRIKNIHFI